MEENMSDELLDIYVDYLNSQNQYATADIAT